MKIIKPFEKYEKSSTEIACFMAGGMGNTEWHEKFIKRLEEHKLLSLVLYNPYNPNVTDIAKQIEWEFEYLNNYINDLFIFSVYFDKYSNQPISMYELGRITVLCQSKYLSLQTGTRKGGFIIQEGFPTVISVHPNSPIKNDLIEQCKLVGLKAFIQTPEEHADMVAFTYRSIKY